MDATQLTGTIAFAVAALACATRRERGWTLVALFFALMALEIAVGWRWALHNWADRSVVPAMAGLGGKRPLQLALLGIAALLYPLLLWRAARGAAGLAAARVAAALLIGLTAVETISLHQTDPLLFTPLGPILRIAWLWLALALTATAAALAGRRRSR